MVEICLIPLFPNICYVSTLSYPRGVSATNKLYFLEVA